MSTLKWDDGKGMGKDSTPVPDRLYDDSYFEKYIEYDTSPMGRSLNRFRRSFVRTNTSLPVLDIGVGAGGFIGEIGKSATGYDVNPAAIQMLRDKAIFENPYTALPLSVPVMTFWDSLEHIENPDLILSKIAGYAFVSLPLFADESSCLASKHYRPGEHIWYWTPEGFLRWMADRGFILINHTMEETRLGREGIYTFGFRKNDDPRSAHDLVDNIDFEILSDIEKTRWDRTH